MSELTLDPSPANIVAQRRRYHELGHQTYVQGTRSRRQRDTLVAERGRIRRWLTQLDALPSQAPCAECGQLTDDPHPNLPGRPMCPECRQAEAEKAGAQ